MTHQDPVPAPFAGMPIAPDAPEAPTAVQDNFASPKPLVIIALGFLIGAALGGWLGGAALGSLFGLIASKAVIGMPAKR